MFRKVFHFGVWKRFLTFECYLTEGEWLKIPALLFKSFFCNISYYSFVIHLPLVSSVSILIGNKCSIQYTIFLLAWLNLHNKQWAELSLTRTISYNTTCNPILFQLYSLWAYFFLVIFCCFIHYLNVTSFHPYCFYCVLFCFVLHVTEIFLDFTHSRFLHIDFYFKSIFFWQPQEPPIGQRV